MISDIATLILAILGILFILLTIRFKLMIWKEQGITLLLSLDSDNREIYSRIVNIKDICEFLGIQKQCTVVLVNYGASKRFIDELRECFSDYGFLKITESDSIKELHT